jgi:hypothetical protein
MRVALCSALFCLGACTWQSRPLELAIARDPQMGLVLTVENRTSRELVLPASGFVAFCGIEVRRNGLAVDAPVREVTGDERGRYALTTHRLLPGTRREYALIGYLHCFDPATMRTRDFDVDAPGVYSARVELRGISDDPGTLEPLARADLWFTSR